MTERSVRLLPMKPAPENTRGGKARLLSRFRDTVRLNANGLSLDPDCAALHPGYEAQSKRASARVDVERLQCRLDVLAKRVVRLQLQCSKIIGDGRDHPALHRGQERLCRGKRRDFLGLACELTLGNCKVAD